MKSNLMRIALLIFVGFFVIYSFIDDRDHPPERARVTDLRIGYYSHDEETWIHTTQFPTNERRLKVCGNVEKSQPVTLLFRISSPADINNFLHLSKWFFEFESGPFCETLYITDDIVSGKYILWVLDARRKVASLEIEFVER